MNQEWQELRWGRTTDQKLSQCMGRLVRYHAVTGPIRNLSYHRISYADQWPNLVLRKFVYPTSGVNHLNINLHHKLLCQLDQCVHIRKVIASHANSSQLSNQYRQLTDKGKYKCLSNGYIERIDLPFHISRRSTEIQLNVCTKMTANKRKLWIFAHRFQSQTK
jgi:hypothetical protein